MSKMFFTFKWGKGIYVTDKQLEQILLQYYTKEEVDKILKQYVEKVDLAAELVNYAKTSYVEQEVDRLDTKIDSVEDTLNNDIQELGNHVNDNARDIRSLEDRVGVNEGKISNNTEAITNNKKLLDETVEALKNARLWNILGVWNNTTTYKIGDVVGDTETQLLYLSVKEPNLNHPLTEKEYWVQVSGVQQINLDDYYNKLQIDDLLNNVPKLNTDNTFASGKRNIYNNLPEVYTVNTLPSRDVEFTTKKYVDNQINNINIGNYVTLNTTQTISGTKTFTSNINANDYLYINNFDGSNYAGIIRQRANLQDNLEIVGNKNIYITNTSNLGCIYINGILLQYIPKKLVYKLGNVDTKKKGMKVGNGYSQVWKTNLYLPDNADKDKTFYIKTTGDLNNPNGADWYRTCIITSSVGDDGYIYVNLFKPYDGNSDLDYWEENIKIVICEWDAYK